MNQFWEDEFDGVHSGHNADVKHERTLGLMLTRKPICEPPQRDDILACECCEQEFLFDGKNWLYCMNCQDWIVLEAT
jgi:hypothetical protein